MEKELDKENTINICYESFQPGFKEKLADVLESRSQVVFDTPHFTVHVFALSNGFDVDVYPLWTKYDDDFEFESESIDGGIVQEGDALDAITYAFEFRGSNNE